MLPSAAPAASRAAACLPRVSPSKPTRPFFFFSWLSTKLAAAGKIEGHARKRPPTPGPNSLAITPTKAVINPPARNLMANSYHLVLLRPDRSMLIVKNLPQPERPQKNRKPKPQHNERTGNYGSASSIPHQRVADAAGIRTERDSPSDHRAGFHARVGGAFA